MEESLLLEPPARICSTAGPKVDTVIAEASPAPRNWGYDCLLGSWMWATSITAGASPTTRP